MRPEDLIEWNRAKPFVPFRIRLKNGQAFEIRHPKMLKVGRSTMHIFSYLGDPDGPHDRVDMIGLILIESIEPIDTPRTA